MAEEKDPIVMKFSEFGGLQNKMNFLTQPIRDEKEAENSRLYIECYEEDGKKTVRLSNDMIVSAKVYPFGDSPILDRNVCVNMFDFYNVIKQCASELISIWIDDEDESNPELVINSYYNADKDYDELEVRLKIHDMGFEKRDIDLSSKAGEMRCVSLDNIAASAIIKHTNIFDKAKNITFVVKDGKMSFECDAGGLKSVATYKTSEDAPGAEDIRVTMPYDMFVLMTGTGSVGTNKIYISEDGSTLYCKTPEYDFMCDLPDPEDPVENLYDEADPYMTIDPEYAKYALGIMNRCNAPSKDFTLLIEPVDKVTADMTYVFADRYSISVRGGLAMEGTRNITIPGDMFEEVFKAARTDAVSFRIKGDTLYIKYDTALVLRFIVYELG